MVWPEKGVVMIAWAWLIILCMWSVYTKNLLSLYTVLCTIADESASTSGLARDFNIYVEKHPIFSN